MSKRTTRKIRMAEKLAEDSARQIAEELSARTQEDIELARANPILSKTEDGVTTITFQEEDLMPPGATSHDAKRRITVMPDHKLNFPELFLDVFIAGPQWERAMFSTMFARARCTLAETPDSADLIVFTGGPDVDPTFYGQEKHRSTQIDPARDMLDLGLYATAMEAGIPMFGVCRGAQFLHVMNGGKLYQDIDHHNGNHPILDLKSRNIIEKTSSVHHQSCMSNVDGGMEILATTSKSRNRALDHIRTEVGTKADIEAYFYRETCCLGVQGHPEYQGYNAYTEWCLKQIENFIVLNPDVDWEGGHRRVKKDIREQRSSIVKAKLGA